MKTILNLFLGATLIVSVASCKKESAESIKLETTVVTDPVIDSKIYSRTNNPSAIEFGGGTMISTGSRVAIYVPYVVANDALQVATITLVDENTQEPIGTYNLLPSSDASAGTLTIPYDLAYVPFLFAAIDLDVTFTGKTVTITTHLNGTNTSSDDVLPNAFSVQ